MSTSRTNTYDAVAATAPVSSDARLRDTRYVWHPWSPNNIERDRLLIVGGQGTTVVDDAGREYLDASSLNATLGYGNARVIKAIERQLQTLHGVDMSATNHAAAGALAERLADLLPDGLSRTLLLNSGSEAIEAALMIATCYARHVGAPRRRVVTFEQGYHGSTLLTRTLSGLPPTAHDHRDALTVDRVPLPLSPRELRGPAGLAPLLAAFASALAEPDEPPLAVVVEPMLNVGGGIMLPAGFLSGLRELCDRSGALLIMDEIFTGYGRTGQMFAFQHEADATPDLLVSSKGLASGYVPISAVTARQDIYDTFGSDPWIGGLRYGHTTSGHAVACAAARETLNVMADDGLVENARDRGTQLLQGLAPLDSSPVVSDVRGFGLVVVVQAVDMPTATSVVRAAQDAGLLVRQQGDAVLVVPSLTASFDDIDQVVSRLSEAVAQVGLE